MNYEAAEPSTLEGRTVVAVSAKKYAYEEGYEEITLTLDDGRRFEFASCSCCGGGVFNEIVAGSVA